MRVFCLCFLFVLGCSSEDDSPTASPAPPGGTVNGEKDTVGMDNVDEVASLLVRYTSSDLTVSRSRAIRWPELARAVGASPDLVFFGAEVTVAPDTREFIGATADAPLELRQGGRTLPVAPLDIALQVDGQRAALLKLVGGSISVTLMHDSVRPRVVERLLQLAEQLEANVTGLGDAPSD